MTTHPLEHGPAIAVTGLRKRYGAHAAVDGIDLRVDHGETVAILGPNGAGKTTTVEILEGFRRADSGSVRVLGTDPAQADRAWRSRVGVVLQDSHDQAELTVREMLRHVAGYYPSPRDPDEVIEAVGLAAKAGARTRALSGGQRRRLDVALGIVGSPELLFLDEPTTGFDPEARRSFWELVRTLSHDGTTVLLTTHYLDEAAALADRVVVVAAGRVAAEGTPDGLGGPEARRPVVHWTQDGVPRSERTARPTALVSALTARLAPEGGEIPGLRIDTPTLEDVYLALVAPASATAEGEGPAPRVDVASPGLPRVSTGGTTTSTATTTETAR